MKIEVDVGCVAVEELAREQLKKQGLDPSKFKMLHNQAMRGDQREDGNLMLVRYTYKSI